MKTAILVATFALAALPAAAAAPAWTPLHPASHVAFVAAMNGAPINGEFRRWDAQIAFDPADLAASQVTAMIDTASAVTGDATRDESLPTADWFATKLFPRAVFRSRRIVAAGPGRYVAEGDLTIRNVTHPVTLPFSLAIAGPDARMKGSLTLDRSAFGVGQGQWKTGDAVALKVRVDLTVVARRR